MANRKQKTFLGAALILCGFLLNTHPAHSAPVALNDSDMDQVMAGNAADGGGVVVGNSSKAVFNLRAGLDLNGEAQQGAKGLNIVNSTESAVANSINIWDGSGAAAAREGSNTDSVLEINQANTISQQQLRSATLSGYLRSEADQTNILNRSGSESSTSKVADIHRVTNRTEETVKTLSSSSSMVDTGINFSLGDQFSFEGNLGQGLAVSGHADVTLGGGSADIAAALGGGISAGASIGDQNGDLKVGDLNLGTTGVTAGVKVTAGLSLLTRLVLPTMSIKIDGTGCGVVLGSCNASSTFDETVTTKTDNSTLDIVENFLSGQSSYTEETTTIYRSPFELGSARAEYIVVDNSSLELDSNVTLELSDAAQKEIKGMNIVNAIGSNVANATNISRTARFEGAGSKMVLNQFNTVRHGR